MRLLLLFALGCTPVAAQVIHGTVRGPAGPIAGASVNIQYFESATCKDLGALTTGLSPALQAEFKRCSRKLPVVTTAANGTFEAKGLKPGWYSVNFQFRLDKKPSGNAPFGRYDGYVVIHTIGERTKEEYFVVAVANESFELKAGTRVEKKFTYRP